MIEHLKTKRFKVCFKVLENSKLKKKFVILEAKSEAEIKSLIFEKYGKMGDYSSKSDENHTKPGILYINLVNPIKNGQITRN